MPKVQFPENLRPLRAEDLERVVEIDAALTGRSRRGFFEKRLTAAVARPQEFVYVGYDGENRLEGFVMARILEGEFGAAAPVARLDAIGVDPHCQSGGIGRSLLDGVDAVLRHKGIGELQSQVAWDNAGLLTFLSATGFQMAPRLVLTHDIGS